MYEIDMTCMGEQWREVGLKGVGQHRQGEFSLIHLSSASAATETDLDLLWRTGTMGMSTMLKMS